MVGNDVVDLRDRDADPETLHPRFDERVFTESELARVRAGGPAVRWRLWAAKEAAYKAVKKIRPQLAFSPSRLRVELFGGEVGVATCREARCLVRLDERDGVVHAVATVVPHDARHRVVHGVLRALPRDALADPDAPGRVARAFATSQLADVLDTCRATLEIRKRARIPELWLAGAPTGCDLSLSHHGGVVAFACEVPAA